MPQDFVNYPPPKVSGLLPGTTGALPSLKPSPKLSPSPSPASVNVDHHQQQHHLPHHAHLDDPSTVILPSGKRVKRPVVAPNFNLYSRLPAHHLLPDGTPNYLPLLLTSSVYTLLPAAGTPLTPARSLSTRLGCQLLFKREDTTPVFSFKLRGAYNLMSQLSEDEKWRGVIACSAGNHAQGVALAGSDLGIACTIVMPLNTPSIKYNNVARLGAKVVLHGADFHDAQRECARLATAHGLTNIPPFDDPYVLAGQGTVAVEILRQTDVNALDAIFVPVGGGGLLAGVLTYIKAVAPPKCRVIGVETFDADCLARSLEAGEQLTLKEVGLFADGTAVRHFGDETWRICSALVDEVVLVSNDEICAAVKDVFEDTRSVPEPSGALSVAGMKKYIALNNLIGKNKRFVSIVSGANLNFSRLRFIAERAEVGEGKEVMLKVVIPERPGAFLGLHTCIHPRAVTEFVYRYSSPTLANVFLSFYLSTPSPPPPPSTSAPSTPSGASTPVGPPSHARSQELSTILSSLTKNGMEAVDISDNEFAKSHGKYLVGGKAPPDERVFRFEFPERPGALRRFLEGLAGASPFEAATTAENGDGDGEASASTAAQQDEGQGRNSNIRFNISLFHYRNQGGDIGKVLAGIQVPPEQTKVFEQWIENLGYPWVEETNNPVLRDFL